MADIAGTTPPSPPFTRGGRVFDWLNMNMQNHDEDLARAFDSQAAKFEVAPVQSDPLALERLVAQADLPQGCRRARRRLWAGPGELRVSGCWVSRRRCRSFARNDRAGEPSVPATRRPRQVSSSLGIRPITRRPWSL